MNPETRLFIDGELCAAASGKTYPNINPATEEVMGQVADAGPADMDRAIAAARRAFDETDWSTNHDFRLKCLQQLQTGTARGGGGFQAADCCGDRCTAGHLRRDGTAVRTADQVLSTTR